MDRFEFIVRRSEEIVVLRYMGPGCGPKNRQTIWTPGKGRKSSTCPVTDKEIKPGEVCWRPITNAVYRGKRISIEGMFRLERRAVGGK